MNKVPLISLLTDFGTFDPYVGILKGVLSQISPGVPIIDICHEIPSGDIRKAAITLWQSYTYFPASSVIVCIVDPGVGSTRRALIIESSGYYFIGPDNGIFTYVLKNEAHAWELSNPKYMLPKSGRTFHGRDIFAPAAAYLAKGVACSDFGPEVKDIQLISGPHFKWIGENQIEGEILYSDHYGNLVTSLGCFEQQPGEPIALIPWLPNMIKTKMTLTNMEIQLLNQVLLPWKNTYSEIPENQCAIIIGSSGLLEIAANCASAENILGLCSGEKIILSFS